jgi:hypothetical protein
MGTTILGSGAPTSCVAPLMFSPRMVSPDLPTCSGSPSVNVRLAIMASSGPTIADRGSQAPRTTGGIISFIHCVHP